MDGLQTTGDLTLCRYLFLFQEWEVFTGLLVSEARGTAAEMKEGLPKWLDVERAVAVTMIQVDL